MYRTDRTSALRSLVLTLFLLLGILSLAACGSDSADKAKKATEACTKKANAGERFYSDDCEKCCKENGAKAKAKYEVAASGPNPVSCTCR